MSQVNNKEQRQLTEKEQQAIQEEFNKLNPSEQKALLAEIEKELKAETAAEAAPLLEFVLKHIRSIIVLLVIIVFIIAGFGFWKYQSETALEEANKEFTKIVSMQDATQRLEKLAAFSNEAPSELQLAIALHEAQAAIEANNFTLAEEKLSALTKEEKFTPLGVALYFSLANTYARENLQDKALVVYEEMLANGPENLRSIVLEEAAFAAENSGNKEKALAFYQELLANNKPENKSAEPFYKARIQVLSAE